MTGAFMADIVSPEIRSRMMSGIRSKNTRPEVRIRKALHAEGFRYRLHKRDIPGKPDMVFPKYGAAIFVHGCFWHGHDCHLFKWPTTRAEFWAEKIGGNKRRDLLLRDKLQERGWRYLIIWECSIKGKHRIKFELLIETISEWVIGSSHEGEISGETPC